MENQRLLLSDFSELPTVILAGRRITKRDPTSTVWQTAVRVIDKRTGKLIWKTDELPSADTIHAVNVDPVRGRVEVIAPQAKLVIAAEGRK